MAGFVAEGDQGLSMACRCPDFSSSRGADVPDSAKGAGVSACKVSNRLAVSSATWRGGHVEIERTGGGEVGLFAKSHDDETAWHSVPSKSAFFEI
jgi:hypothetical protein